MIWTIGALISLVLGLGLLGYGLFWDRPGWRGRPARRCRGCGYDLTGAGEVPLTCTECGRVHGREGSLRRVRRHKRVAAAGVAVMLVAGGLAMVPAYQKQRLLVHVPHWVLVDVMPWMPERAQAVSFNTNLPANELAYRIAGYDGREASHEEIVRILNQMCEGGWGVVPGSERWAATLGSWLSSQKFRFQSGTRAWQYPDGAPADQALMDVLERITNIAPDWNPYTRAIWPHGSVVTIWSGKVGRRHTSWMYLGSDIESANLVVSGHQPEPEEIDIKLFGNSFQLKARGEPGDVLRGELTLHYHRVPEDWDYESVPEPLRTERFEIEWLIAERMSDVLELVDHEAIRDTMIAHTFNGVLLDPGGFDFDGDWLAPEFDRIGFGVIIQVFDGEERIAQSEQRWMGRDGEWIGRIQSMMGTPYEQYLEYPERAAEALAKGTLRFKIIGDPELALEMHEAERAWQGEIEVGYEEAAEIARAYFGDPYLNPFEAQEETPPE